MRPSLLCLALVLCSTTMLMAESSAGVRWTAPAGWKPQAARPLRAATYMVAPSAGDRDEAECGVYFFGAGQGGTIDANIDRWKGQFRAPGGGPAQGAVSKQIVHGLTVTRLDTSGEYSGAGAPLGGQTSVRPGYRLLGAIVEGPGGNIFIKFTGPVKTIAANRQKFEQLLGSFEKEK